MRNLSQTPRSQGLTNSAAMRGQQAVAPYRPNQLTTKDFIQRARNIHGSRYAYSKTCYTRMADKVLIECRRHGEFSQTPINHFQGQGCPTCGREKSLVGNLSDTETFVKKAVEVHGKLYDYSAVCYTTSSAKVKIRCKLHGIFEQRPNAHLAGNTCPSCCPRTHSKIAIAWIEFEAKRRNMKAVEHAGNTGEYNIPGTRFWVDGYHARTRTIFEFYGDAFHGNPKRYAPESTPHPFNKGKTARQLYQATMRREKRLAALGYRIISVWESDYKLYIKELQ